MEDGRRTVDPANVRFTQKTISDHFSTTHDGETIDHIAWEIRAGRLHPTNFPRMRVIEHRGLMWSLNNRRLWVYRIADVPQVAVDVVEPRDPRFSGVSTRGFTRLLRGNASFIPRNCEEFEESPDVFSAMSSASYLPTVLNSPVPRRPDPTTRPARQVFDMGGDQIVPTAKEPEPEPAPEPELKRESKPEPQSEPEPEPDSNSSQTEPPRVEVPLSALCALPIATPVKKSEAGWTNSLRDCTSAREEERRSFRCSFWIFVAALAIGIPAASAVLSFVRESVYL